MKLKIFFYVILYATTFFSKQNEKIDLTIIGKPLFSDGLGRLPISVIFTLQNHLKINFIKSRDEKINFSDTPKKVINLIKNSKQQASFVSILYDAPWFIKGQPYLKIPDSNIKLAYSMLESSLIPKKWVNIFNNNFDAVIVPDETLIQVYQNSGVKIPIFVLPCILFLKKFLNRPAKKLNGVFTFGISAAFGVEKNHDILIKAFAKTYGKNNSVRLLLHGRWGDTKNLKLLIEKTRCKNIFLIEKTFSQKEYIDFMSSLDCYVLVSRGEGFSITPREALALGIPCILSNNTAHTTICSTGLVKPVESKIKTPIFYKVFNSHCGYQLTCNIDDVASALNEVYENYDTYKNKALMARQWVRQYLPKNIAEYYLSLISPKKVILADKNEIKKDCLVTNNESLYKKYLSMINEKKESK